jgi:hypothetical protein
MAKASPSPPAPAWPVDAVEGGGPAASEADWIEVPESQSVRRFRYRETGRILAIEFTSGGAYEYFDVPVHVFEEMKAAASKGLFVTRNIKSVYRYTRL